MTMRLIQGLITLRSRSRGESIWGDFFFFFFFFSPKKESVAENVRREIWFKSPLAGDFPLYSPDQIKLIGGISFGDTPGSDLAPFPPGFCRLLPF